MLSIPANAAPLPLHCNLVFQVVGKKTRTRIEKKYVVRGREKTDNYLLTLSCALLDFYMVSDLSNCLTL